MEFKAHISFPLTDRSYLNIVKRDITKLAESYDFSAAEVGKINVIISEMASNLIKHSTINGEILIKPFGKLNSGLEIICIDKGPGINDLTRMQEDGVSTAGTRGEGLGAIKRMADDFDIYSGKGIGTTILARVYKSRAKPKLTDKKRFEIGVVMVPKTGETDCGDAWAMQEVGNTCRLLVADGLGHGEYAQEAGQLAVNAFLDAAGSGPSETIRSIHTNIKRSRGAVGNVAEINVNNLTFKYCGVGNIAGRVLIGIEAPKSIISYNGILGHNIPNGLNNHQIDWNNNCLLILHSDGIKSKWDLTKFKDITRHDPSLIAAIIYKEFTRGTDDNLVLVARTRN